MSRNFDLLAEFERERDSNPKEVRAQVAPDRQVVPDRTVVKDFAAGTGTSAEPEMLRLVQNLFLPNNGEATRQVVFCGVDKENGSSSVCANAARTLATHTSKSVCLIDANLRTPRLSRIFGTAKPIPVSSKSASPREMCVQVGNNLWLAGSELLSDGHGAMLPAVESKHRLTQLNAAFDYLLIDAPGLGVSQDGALLAQVVEAAVLIIDANRTRRVNAARAKEALESAGVPLLGTVLHNRSFPIPELLYKRI